MQSEPQYNHHTAIAPGRRYSAITCTHHDIFIGGPEIYNSLYAVLSHKSCS